MAKANWRPYDQLTDEEKREFHRKGGLASAQKRREQKQLRDYLSALLQSDTNTGTIAGDLCWQLIQKALTGDVKAFECIRSTLGEDAPQKVEVDNNIIKVTIDDDGAENKSEDI